MKLETHVLAGFASGALLAYVLSLGELGVGLLGCIAALEAWLIDALGHSRSRYWIKRNHLHSILGVLVLALAITVVPSYYALRLGMPWFAAMIFLAALLGGLSHLALDVITENGVYLLWPFSSRRYCLAHLSYDDPVVNALVIAASLATLVVLAW